MKKQFFTALILSLSWTNLGQAKQIANCEAIDSAISATEDFVEVALGVDQTARAGAQKALVDSLSAIETTVPSDVLLKARSGLMRLDKALADNHISEAALLAMDNYEILVRTYAQRLPTTQDVAMLDHAGFKLHALLSADSIDWHAIGTELTKAGGDLKSASQKLNDKAIRDLLGTLSKGLDDAYRAQNKAWEHNMAQLLLDSVDLIERTVKNPSKSACN
jgi:hypothetical protein